MQGVRQVVKKAPQRTNSTSVVEHGRAHALHDERTSILNLQQTVGNQAVLQMLRKQEGDLNSPAAGSQYPPAVQPKLTINSPGDIDEQEADRVSRQVMGSPDDSMELKPSVSSAIAGVQRACACGGTCPDCQRDETREQLQMKPAQAAHSGQAIAPPIVHEVLNSPGQPLDEGTRAYMEPRFGRDFSDVRVHLDAQAAESARAVRARAYTVGQDIVFGAGQYQAGSDAGRALLAHELAHTVQQGATPLALQRQPVPGPQDEPCPRGEMRLGPGEPCFPVVLPGQECPAGEVKFGGDCVPLREHPLRGKLVSPAAVPADPDANEREARVLAHTAGEMLPKIDRASQKEQANEDAAHALVMAAFGGPEGVNAVFEYQLSPIVKTMVDEYYVADVRRAKLAGKNPDEEDIKTANRAQFLARMRLYFNSWAEVVDHFSAIERINAKVDLKFTNVDMYLHRDAKARFDRAASVLQSKGHPLPEIGEGFSLRGYHRGKIQHPGWMIHAMGYAFDIMAFSNPRIANVENAPFQYPDILAVQGKAGIGPAKARMNLDLRKPSGALIASTESMVESMGKRTATSMTLSAADDTDALAVQFFKQFELQFQQMQAGSKAFMGSLSKAHRDAALALRDSYFEVLKSLNAERAKKPPDPAAIAKLENSRAKVLSGLPPLLSEWIAAIDEELKAEIAKHPGMDKSRSPSEINRDLKAKHGEEEAATAELGRQKAAKSRSDSEFDAAQRTVEQTKQLLKEQAKAEAAEKSKPRSPSGDWQAETPSAKKLREKHEALDAALEAAKNKRTLAGDAIKDALHKITEIEATLAAVRDASTKLKDELKSAEKISGWAYVDRLRELRRALASPDLSTPAGVSAFEQLTTGDLSELTGRGPVVNPPLLRLLDIGFFNPKGNFDLAFFEEMAHSGFWPGASWNFGSVDSMHFELVEGRHSILKPGSDTP